MTWQPKKLTREQLAERRAEAVRLLEAGEMKQVEIARHLGVTEAAVSKWKKQLVREGPQALQMRKATGRPPKLDETAKQTLVKKLEEGAVAAGFPTEQWTQARVKQVIEREFGVQLELPSCHDDICGVLLVIALIVLTFVLVIGSALIPHFWLLSGSILISIMALIAIHDLRIRRAS